MCGSSGCATWSSASAACRSCTSGSTSSYQGATSSGAPSWVPWAWRSTADPNTPAIWSSTSHRGWTTLSCRAGEGGGWFTTSAQRLKWCSGEIKCCSGYASYLEQHIAPRLDHFVVSCRWVGHLCASVSGPSVRLWAGVFWAGDVTCRLRIKSAVWSNTLHHGWTTSSCHAGEGGGCLRQARSACMLYVLRWLEHVWT